MNYGDGLVKPNRTRVKRSGLNFTSEDVNLYLYGRTAVLPVTVEESSAVKHQDKKKTVSQSITANSVDILQLRYKPGVEIEFGSTEEFNKVMHIIKTIPLQLQLCYSSVPRTGFGICAKQTIVSGTWIGPFEGKRITLQQFKPWMDTKYVWEVYKNGKIDHYIDGSDGTRYGWMKYVRCARHTNEQNMVAFQFGADIYFQAYRKIMVGEELLVWYAEYYEKHYEIPIGVRKIGKAKTSAETASGKQEFPGNFENAKRDVQITPQAQQIASATVSSSVPQTSQEAQASTDDLPVITRTVSMTNGGLGQSTGAVVNQTIQSPPNAKTLQTRLWRCEHCMVKFPQRWALQVHTCPCDVTETYKCSLCHKAFIDKEDLQYHTKECSGGRSHKCGYCARSFSGVKTLTKHLKVHSRQKIHNGKKRRGRISNYEKFFLARQ